MTEAVLVIDADRAAHDALAAALAPDRVPLLHAADGPAGLRLALRERPAVAILDPIGAEEAWQALRRERPELPILVLARAGAGEERLRWLDLGATDFLAVPFEPVEARARVRAALALARARAAVESRTRLDPVTRCFGRGFLEERLASEVAAARRHGRALGLLLVDVDGLDAINAAFGRRMGDRVLQRVAEQVAAAVRSEDFVARYDGDSFAVLVRESDEAGVGVVARRLAAGVRAIALGEEDQRVEVSVSVGAAALARVLRPDRAPAEAVQLLLVAAEDALGRAKARGRGQVVLWEDDYSAR